MRGKIKTFQTTVFLLAILIVVGISIILFRTCNSSKEAFFSQKIPEKSKSLKVGIEPSSSEIELPERKELKPSTPEELGLTVYYEDNKPKTQEEWNDFIAELYQKNRKEFEEGGYTEKLGGNPYKQLDEVDLEEVDTNRVRLDEKISECEEKLKTNPDDKGLKEQLENWQKLKALLIAVYGEKSNVEK